MARAVFTTKVDPTYDDLPEERYHFPRTYLRVAMAALDDWVIYYEPRRTTGDRSSRGGRQAYFATARVREVVPDPQLADHFYAKITDYLEFDRPVPFQEAGHYWESALRKPDGSTNKGAFGRAVRTLPDAEYDLILQAGFAHALGERARPRPAPDVPEEPFWHVPGLAEEQLPLLADQGSRPVLAQIIRRPFRDRAFAAAVKTAYGDTCAVTGIRMINGLGRSEVQAAHIRPVAQNGPDSPRNGIALSATVHWMFDRGLISVTDDHRLLIARGHVPAAMHRLIVADGQLRVPDNPALRPHPQYLQFHREQVFKG